MNKLRLLLARLGYCSKPNFLIIGAQKSGTSSLYEALCQHPMISGALWKEIHYFDQDHFYQHTKNYLYHQYFPIPAELSPGTKLLFEATPMYLHHPEAAERIYRYNPSMKLICILRNPAYRALSAWTMYHHEFAAGSSSHLHDSRRFQEAIEQEIDQISDVNFYNDVRAYVKRGIYYEQVRRYLEYFPPESLLILDYENLSKNQTELTKTITSFLDIPSYSSIPVHTNQRLIKNDSLYPKELAMLKAFYRPYNEKLYKLIDQKFDW